jgi:hypothetical protein
MNNLTHKDMPRNDDIYAFWKDFIISIKKDPNKCWGCQKLDYRECERAHIEPLRNQSDDNREWINSPSNLLLLCHFCHQCSETQLESTGEKFGIRKTMLAWLCAFDGYDAVLVPRVVLGFKPWRENSEPFGFVVDDWIWEFRSVYLAPKNVSQEKLRKQRIRKKKTRLVCMPRQGQRQGGR